MATPLVSLPSSAYTLSASNSVGTGLMDMGAELAPRRIRRSSTRASEPSRSSGGSTPQPASSHGEPEDSVAVGSLTGRLKYSLKAFSRKVVRSLNFAAKASDSPTTPNAHVGSPPGRTHSRSPRATIEDMEH
eukprot:CAMPEP_0202922108 /NCGR_PEP_ID=MMETSP1392-20130828/77750_1 /ASSEMBLY_ACC=CAM_ASM_000868 /TAXON_ID=225041 /ORGANISM="Chlamydomonas chlamydogama, Strain SAG 11-48b" /LENGTH=131 /DNA_ID=CAMNT_0049615717 /DNA_START=77 /DNA_END=472 /DNA_ORIENTATION=-